jgi:hypothetical protein
MLSIGRDERVAGASKAREGGNAKGQVVVETEHHTAADRETCKWQQRRASGGKRHRGCHILVGTDHVTNPGFRVGLAGLSHDWKPGTV